MEQCFRFERADILKESYLQKSTFVGTPFQGFFFKFSLELNIESGWPAVLEFLELLLNCKWFLKNP